MIDTIKEYLFLILSFIGTVGFFVIAGVGAFKDKDIYILYGMLFLLFCLFLVYIA